MTIDYKIVNGTQVAVICDIENANLTKDEWKKFGDLVVQRFENMLPTVTIVGVDYHVLRRIIESRSGDALLAHAICGRLWEMGINKIGYLPASAQPQERGQDKLNKATTKELDKTTSKPRTKIRDYVVNGGRGNCGKPVEQLDGDGQVIRVFCTAAEAGRYYSINPALIRDCCNGKWRTAGGRIWRYKEA